MVGTLFLFCFWPSFNAALLKGAAQHRAVINTLLSICASSVTAFLLSKAIHGGRAFDMEHIQNSTLAGGVVVGAACDMLTNPWGALLAGSVAGAVSVYGFSYLVPALKRAGLTDTCGISSLHFMPGFIGGIASAIAAAGVTSPDWDATAIVEDFSGRAAGRSALMQGCFQMAMTVISMAFGALSGAATGWLMRMPFAEPQMDGYYEDEHSWNVPYDEEEDPEQDSDFAQALERAKAEVTASVLAHLSKTLGDKVAPPARSAPGPAATGGSTHGGAARISANQRFLEGSVHGGSPGGGLVFGGEGSVRGRRAGLPAAGGAAAV